MDRARHPTPPPSAELTPDDQAATLIVKKVVVNDNGGAKTAADFTFSVNGGTAAAFEADGQNDLTVNAGHIQAQVAGLVVGTQWQGNDDEDTFLLGPLAVGNVVELTARLPTGSPLSPWLRVLDSDHQLTDSVEVMWRETKDFLEL